MTTVKSKATSRLTNESGSLWCYEDSVRYTDEAGNARKIDYLNHVELDRHEGLVQVVAPGPRMDPVIERFRGASILNDPPVSPAFVWNAKSMKDGVTLWAVTLIWTVKGQAVTLWASWALTSPVGDLIRLNVATELEAEGALAAEADRLRREEASRLSIKK